MKRKFKIFVVSILCILGLVGCGRNDQEIINGVLNTKGVWRGAPYLTVAELGYALNAGIQYITTKSPDGVNVKQVKGVWEECTDMETGEFKESKFKLILTNDFQLELYHMLFDQYANNDIWKNTYGADCFDYKVGTDKKLGDIIICTAHPVDNVQWSWLIPYEIQGDRIVWDITESIIVVGSLESKFNKRYTYEEFETEDIIYTGLAINSLYTLANKLQEYSDELNQQ